MTKFEQNKQIIAVTLNLKHVQARTVEMRSRVEEIHSVSVSIVYAALNIVRYTATRFLTFLLDNRIERT